MELVENWCFNHDMKVDTNESAIAKGIWKHGYSIRMGCYLREFKQ